MKHLVTLLLALVFAGKALAADTEGAPSSRISVAKDVTLNINALSQFRYTWADGEPATKGTSSFGVKVARLKFSGDLPENFKYSFLLAFERMPSTYTVATNSALYEWTLSYAPGPAFGLSAGQFAVPSGGEVLAATERLDFVSRYYAQDRMLNPSANRDTGVMASGKVLGEKLQYWAGVFNGEGANIDPNANRKFLYAGRLAWTPWRRKGGFRDDAFTAAASATAERTQADASSMRAKDLGGIAFTRAYARRVYEGDAAWRRGPLALSGEYMTAWLGGGGADPKVKGEGWHLTGAYLLPGDRWELLVRRQAYDPDVSVRNKYDLAWTTLGVNRFIKGQTVRLAFNYTFKEEKKGHLDNDEAAVQLQLWF